MQNISVVWWFVWYAAGVLCAGVIWGFGLHNRMKPPALHIVTVCLAFLWPASLPVLAVLFAASIGGTVGQVVTDANDRWREGRLSRLEKEIKELQ